MVVTRVLVLGPTQLQEPWEQPVLHIKELGKEIVGLDLDQHFSLVCFDESVEVIFIKFVKDNQKNL